MVKIRDDAGRIKGLPQEWEQYALCLFFLLLWPLAPIALEKLLTGRLAPTSMTLTAFMYAVGLGISSRNAGISYLSLATGVLVAVFFGFAVHVGSSRHPSEDMLSIAGTELLFGRLSLVSMVLLFVPHAIERYNRHVAEKSPFLELGRKDKAPSVGGG